MSWEDEIWQASPGKERALVLLARARGRNSKRAAEDDIEDAIAEADVGGILSISDLLARYGLPYSMAGLGEMAVRFAEDLKGGVLVPEEREEQPSIQELSRLLVPEDPVVSALLDALRACAEGDMFVAATALMRAIIINSLPSDGTLVGVDGVHVADDSVIGTAHYLTEAFKVVVPLL